MGIAHVGGIPMKHAMTSSQVKKAQARIDAAHNETRGRFDGLGAAITATNIQQQREHLNWLTTDPTALLSHAVKANAAMHPTKRVRLEACLELPKKVAVDQPIPERVEMYAKPKSDGYRVIHEFGITHRSIQYGIRQAASRYFKPRPFQYTQLGVASAISRVKKALLEGKVHVAEVDIRNFYGSFREDRLLNEFTLPEAVELPKAVVKHAVFARHYEAEWKKGGLNKVPHSLLPNLNQEAHSGLSTGSGCSPIIAMITVSNLAWSTMADVDMVNFFDNFLVLASSSALLGKAISKLSAAIEQLPGGHFTPREVFRSHAADGFDFLGHCLYLDGNVVRIAPTEGNFHDFCSECDRLDTQLGNYLFRPNRRDIPRGVGVAVDELRYILGFLSAFNQCGPKELAFYEGQLEDVLDSLYRAGVSHEMLARAVTERRATAHAAHQVYS